MINVDKAYSVLIKNSNRYWINKHRLGPQAALVCQSVLHWIDMCTLPMSLRLKGVSKKLRDRTLYHRHYNRSNASYLETDLHRWRWVRQSFDPRDQWIRSCDLYNLWTPGFIYDSRFKNWTGINQSGADNIPRRSSATSLFSVFRLTSWEKTSLLIEWMKCFPTTCRLPNTATFRPPFPNIKYSSSLRALLLIFEYKFIIAGLETLREANYRSRGARAGS